MFPTPPLARNVSHSTKGKPALAGISLLPEFAQGLQSARDVARLSLRWYSCSCMLVLLEGLFDMILSSLARPNFVPAPNYCKDSCLFCKKTERLPCSTMLFDVQPLLQASANLVK